MKLSNLIEQFIKDMLSESGEIELKRNELANHFNCVPSQINYVISTRFSPERGYIVESRRGGGGYIKISQVAPVGGNYVMHTVNVIGGSLAFDDARAIVQNLYDNGFLTADEAKIVVSALGDKAIPLKRPEQDMVRAAIFKNILVNIAK